MENCFFVAHFNTSNFWSWLIHIKAKGLCVVYAGFPHAATIYASEDSLASPSLSRDAVISAPKQAIT